MAVVRPPSERGLQNTLELALMFTMENRESTEMSIPVGLWGWEDQVGPLSRCPILPGTPGCPSSPLSHMS